MNTYILMNLLLGLILIVSVWQAVAAYVNMKVWTQEDRLFLLRAEILHMRNTLLEIESRSTDEASAARIWKRNLTSMLHTKECEFRMLISLYEDYLRHFPGILYRYEHKDFRIPVYKNT